MILRRMQGEIEQALDHQAPTLERGFHHACEDLRPHRTFVVFSGDVGYPMPGGVEVVALRALAERLGTMPVFTP